MRKVFSKRLKPMAIGISGVLLLSSILTPLGAGCDNERLVDNSPKKWPSLPNDEGKSMRTIWDLQGAYDAGLLTMQDLMSIAYYQNGSYEVVGEAFIPAPKNPEFLSAAIENAIKESMADALRNQNPHPIPEAMATDVEIIRYYGTYNSCVAVMLTISYYEHDCAEWYVAVAGVVLHYNNGNRIIIWHQN